MEYIILAIIIAFLAYSYIREEQWRSERQDLMDRLMSKDIAEYKEITSDPTVYEPVTATEEKEYWMEIEEQKR